MSLAVMSAGSGYRYLLRHTATGDIAREPGQALVDYYAATGLPPGRWTGAGLPGLGTGDGTDITPGTLVTEEAMGRLFGSGHDPITGGRLGLSYPKFKTVEERIGERVARLPQNLSAAEHAAAVAEIESQERARPQRSAVAGYDLTFTVPKSVSVLWALGDAAVRRAVEDAHRDAVAAVLGLIEERFLHTRIGEGSKIRVPARGAVAAAFDHWDTRAGDPNLHTHLVLANKVQGPDGRWRAIDGQVLFAAAVACSEIYDSTIADTLATRLAVRFGYRDRGPRRTPAFEIEGIPDPLLHAFSSRSQAIGVHLQDLVAAFTDTHGREPNRVEVVRLRQQATLATRPDKHVTALAQLRQRWRATAETVTGQPAEAIVRGALTSTDGGGASILTTDPTPPPVDVSGALLARYADATVAGVSTRRATWTHANLLAQAARATRALRQPDPATRIALLDRVVTAALERCVALDPPATGSALMTTATDGVTSTPTTATAAAGARRNGLQQAGEAPQVVRPDADAPEPAYTTWEILAAEARLLAAHDDTTAPTADPGPLHATAARPMPGTRRISAEQLAAATTIIASARRLDVLVGPAGSGKTTTLALVRGAWEYAHGAGSVIGLAPSATAAAQLGLALRIPAETVAKWIHHSQPGVVSGSAADTGAGAAAGERWRFRAGQLVLIDEAAMTATTDLDHLITQAGAAGAKVVLIGDHAQLGAVDAGGAFALLAGEGHTVELDTLHRFTHVWEATATRQLRVGDPACLDAYTAHGRLHDGPTEAMIEAAYRAWATDITAGRHSLLLASDHATVTALNTRARTDRVRAGYVDLGREVRLHDGTSAAQGDVVFTRRNQRHLQRPGGGYVRNGDQWHVIAVHHDGALDVAPTASAGGSAQGLVRLPAHYVRDHVELGYASTIHRAQGATADSGHLIADARMSREALYVGLTRGRHANHAYIATDAAAAEHVPTDDLTARQILEAVLRSPSSDTSAMSAWRRRQAAHIHPPHRIDQWQTSHAPRTRSAARIHPPDRPPNAGGITR